MSKYLCGMIIPLFMMAVGNAAGVEGYVSTEAIVREVQSYFPDSIFDQRVSLGETGELFSPMMRPDEHFPLMEYKKIVAYRVARLKEINVDLPKLLDAGFIERYTPITVVVAIRLLDRIESKVFASVTP